VKDRAALSTTWYSPRAMTATAPLPATRLPAVRARYMQTFASHVDALPPADRHAIREAVAAGTWQAIESASLLGWLPLAANLECTRAVAERLGPDRTHRFFRTLLFDTSNTPLLRGLVQSVLRVAVQDPGLYLPWISKGFELMFRDAGRWTVAERAPGSAVLEVRGLPPECQSDAVWLESAASALCALLDLTHLEGTITVQDTDSEAGVVTFRMRWKPR
jgi:hypothetical protein